ncbi:alpha/beta hydrolase family protein [Sphingomonas canadensis]|nr:S9 family peptidase [Sphingomonas canadensis]
MILATAVACALAAVPAGAQAPAAPPPVAPAAVPAQPEAPAAKPPLAPMDVFALEDAVDPQISPDGKRIVYLRAGYDMAKDARRAQLWIIGADGGNARPLTQPGATVSPARWSPDGTRIVFMAVRDGAPKLVVRWIADDREVEIANLPGAPDSITWSPDGKQIAFATLVPDPPRQVGTPPSAPPGAEWKPAPRVIDRSYYRADGIGYLPSGKRQLFLVSADGGAARRLTSDRHDYGAPPVGPGFYDWTPDGKALIVEVNTHSDLEFVRGKFFDSGLYQLDIASGAMTKILDRNGPEGSPAVSPDGQWIAFTGYLDKGEFHGGSQLSVLNRRTGEIRVLSKDLDRDVGMPAWSADSRHVYAIYADGGMNYLARFDLNGGRAVIASGLGMAHTAYSAVPSYSLARDGSYAMQVSDATSTGNIAAGGPGRAARRVTTLNDTLLGSRAIARLEEFRYTSSAGGLPMEGWILYPPGFDPSRKYPMILEIHGGPDAGYGARFDIEKQIMAGAGYVVVYTNPRGSTGYGQRFVNLITDRFPGDEYDDLMSGVDAVIARGFIDPARLYVTGGSGGGTLTAWLTQRTDRFRAAAVLYPVVDWQSQALTSDIMPLIFNGFFHSTPWNDQARYREQSMLRMADRVKTPTLVMTGEADYRTPISESEQYYAALRYHGVESVFIRYPMENHGLRAFPSHFAAKVAQIIGWFEEHR